MYVEPRDVDAGDTGRNMDGQIDKQKHGQTDNLDKTAVRTSNPSWKIDYLQGELTEEIQYFVT